MNRLHQLVCICLVVVGVSFFAPRALAQDSSDVRITNLQGEVITIFSPFEDPNALIGSVATADLGHDGIQEILIGSGEDADPTVSVFRQDGSFIGSFLAYDVGYRGGVVVRACDVDGDGEKEIITGALWNGGSHVRIFTAMGNVKYPGFFAFDPTFTGGITLACGDVTGNGTSEIIVGASLGGGPVIKIFDAFGNVLLEQFVDSAQKNTGVAVAVGDVDSNGRVEILSTTLGYDVPTVTAWSYNEQSQSLVALLQDIASNASTQLIMPVGVLNNTMLVASQGYVEPHVFSINSSQNFSAFSASAEHAVSADIIEHNGVASMIVLANTAPRMNNDLSKKSIRIDVSQQRLTTYEFGIPMHTFLVSTAKQGYVTPRGKTAVTHKLLYHDYVWSFGVGDPRNYNVPNVKWNLRIYDHIYIHWAYWHNNFGNPMSHGCINANEENSEWIYMWSEVGTSVNIVD